MQYTQIDIERKRVGMSQKELANEIPMSEMGLSKSIKNETMTVATLERICEILGCSIVNFFPNDSMYKAKDENAWREKYYMLLEQHAVTLQQLNTLNSHNGHSGGKTK